jgi:hypothetical protein
MILRPSPEDVDLLAQLIDMRDSAHLAGHRSKPFVHTAFNGGDSAVMAPGQTGAITVPTMALGRLRDLGVLRVISDRGRSFTFDLADDVRDRIEEMRIATGMASRMGELQAAVDRAAARTSESEAARRELEVRVAAATQARATHRSAFARRVGRWVRLLTSVVLGALYFGAVTVGGYVLSSNLPLAVAAGFALTAGLAVLDWQFHVDGFWLARRLGAWIESGIERWLARFES